MADNPHDPTEFPSTLAYRGPLPKAAPLERLGQYRIIKPLGRGGMGVVYLAEDTQLHRKAALKVMRADYAADPEAMTRFLREAQAAARLKHDHIVTIYQVGEERGIPFLAMEFLAGKSLEEWLRPDRRATIVEALLISRQIARGLTAAHTAGLIHRDIKPANLWLEAPRGRVKVLDFGLARHTSGEHPALTQDGTVVGTPAFMAPEQARGDMVDHRCDLFSLGCVMYRMITGRLPFQGTTTFAVLSAIAAETPTSPIRIRDEIPHRLSELVDQLLAKKPEQRPASAQAVLDELTEIERQVKQPPTPPSLLGPPVVPAAVLPRGAAVAVPVAAPADTVSFNAPSSGPTLKLAKPARRKGKNRPVAWLALGGGAVVLVLVGLLAVLMNQPDREEATRPKTPKRNNASPPPTEVSVAKKTEREPATFSPLANVRDTSSGPPREESSPTTSVTPAGAATWPSDAESFGGHHYKFYPEELTWHEARQRCERAGGHLAVVDSASENGFLARLVEEGKWLDAWIGITDEVKEGTWVTVLGQPVTYTNWFTGQPNNKQGAEHYALMSGQIMPNRNAVKWRWCDQPTEALPTPHKPGYLCEWEPGNEEKVEEEFTSLFDGKTLSGWQGDKSAYSVEDGLLIGSGNPGNLYTDKQYSDFELRFEFRLAARANSGILVRTPITTRAEASFRGNEIQILEDMAAENAQPWQMHGALYGVAAPKTGHLKPAGQWNSQTILCHGSKLQVVLNGESILDVDLAALAKQPSPDNKPHPGLSNKAGYIGLMNHTNRVEFRNLQIRELK